MDWSNYSTLQVQAEESFQHGTTRQWLIPDKLIIYTLGDSHRDAIDSYIESVWAIIETWDVKKPLFTIHDLTHVDLLSPYAQRRGMELSQKAKNMEKEYRAMVIKKGVAGSIMKLFFGQLNRFFISEMQIFTDVEEALKWLLQKIENEDAKKKVAEKEA